MRLGENYEQLLSRHRRKTLGAFYTPDAVIDYMLENTVAKADLLKNPFPRILDPACGCGYFLLKSYDLLYRMFCAEMSKLRELYGEAEYVIADGLSVVSVNGEAYWRPENLPYHIITHCLFGADIDGDAADIAAAALLEKAACFRLEPNVVVCDSLAKWEAADVFSQPYDYVIGNPPYVSYGLRGTATLDKQRYQQLAAAYPHSAEYKLSLYALFFERGVELLKAGGRLAYITPDSFLSGKYFSKLRNFLAGYAIDRITLLEFAVFSGAAIGKGVITVLSKSDNKNHQIAVAVADRAEQLKTGSLAKQFQYRQQHMGPRFALFFDNDELEVVNAMQSVAKRFTDCCGLYSGCIARYGQKSIVSSQPAEQHSIYDNSGKLVLYDEHAGGRWHRLIGRGAYINRYCIKPAEQYIYIHEDEQVRRRYAKSGFDLKKYALEKLFLRQTGQDLIAAYDNDGYLCLNNMHILYITDSAVPLKMLLALLNSRLYNYYYQCITRETNRVLPQVDINIVKQMPVLAIADVRQAVQIVDELITGYAGQAEALSPASRRRLRECRDELEIMLLGCVDLKKHTQNKILKFSN